GRTAPPASHARPPAARHTEIARHGMTEAAGPRDAAWFARIVPHSAPTPKSVPVDITTQGGSNPLRNLQILDFERQASFFMTGGLVAVHAEGRDRDAIWAALKRREVYGTSGERILLWFDLLNGPDAPLPMGSDTTLETTPHFRVRA